MEYKPVLYTDKPGCYCWEGKKFFSIKEWNTASRNVWGKVS
jgi:hypothetical protein